MNPVVCTACNAPIAVAGMAPGPVPQIVYACACRVWATVPIPAAEGCRGCG